MVLIWGNGPPEFASICPSEMLQNGAAQTEEESVKAKRMRRKFYTILTGEREVYCDRA